MSSADGTPVAHLAAWLLHHRDSAYLWLALGAMVETVLPFALLVPGEVVFLAGAVLAGMRRLHLAGVALALVGGGLAGDQLSYWLGRRYGRDLLRRLARWPGLGRLLSRRRRARARALLRRRGGRAVFLARLSGPLSWVIPTLAGAARVPYRTFLLCNTPAVVIGIGQFVLVGYLGGRHLPWLLAWLHGAGAVLLGVLLLAAALYRWRRRAKLA